MDSISVRIYVLNESGGSNFHVEVGFGSYRKRNGIELYEVT